MTRGLSTIKIIDLYSTISTEQVSFAQMKINTYLYYIVSYLQLLEKYLLSVPTTITFLIYNSQGNKNIICIHEKKNQLYTRSLTSYKKPIAVYFKACSAFFLSCIHLFCLLRNIFNNVLSRHRNNLLLTKQFLRTR